MYSGDSSYPRRKSLIYSAGAALAAVFLWASLAKPLHGQEEEWFFFFFTFTCQPPMGSCFHCSNQSVEKGKTLGVMQNTCLFLAQHLVTTVHQIKSNSINDEWECVRQAKIEFTYTSCKLEKHYMLLRPKAGKKITDNVQKGKEKPPYTGKSATK